MFGRSAVTFAVLALGTLAITVGASGPATPETCPILHRFLSVPDPAPNQYRALRHLEARNEKSDRTAWMDAWTEVSANGSFQYTVAADGGSTYIRDHVLVPALETEKRMAAQRLPTRSSITPANYVFEDRGPCPDGLATLGVKPRRKDALMVDGSIFVRPDDGELVRLEGQLVKPPSFWTRHVQIVQWFERVAGFRMPVAVESVANVLIFGRSTFRMTYEYESVNGQRVGSPQPRAVARATPRM